MYVSQLYDAIQVDSLPAPFGATHAEASISQKGLSRSVEKRRRLSQRVTTTIPKGSDFRAAVEGLAAMGSASPRSLAGSGLTAAGLRLRSLCLRSLRPRAPLRADQRDRHPIQLPTMVSLRSALPFTAPRGARSREVQTKTHKLTCTCTLYIHFPLWTLVFCGLVT